MGSFALFAISLSCESKRKFSNLWISLFLVLAFIRVFFDKTSGIEGNEWFNFWLSCASFIYVFCGVLLFYVVYCHADNIRQYLVPIVWVSIANTVLALAQRFDYGFMWAHTTSICGFMENSAQLGQYSALSLPILLFFHPLLALIPIISLCLSLSISPILATLLGIGLFGVLSHKNKGFFIGLGIILVLLGASNFGYIKGKFAYRPPQWRKTLQVALQSPFLGGGYRSFHEKVAGVEKNLTIGGSEYLRAHSDPLHTVQELGFPIGAVVIMFFVGLYKKFRLAIKKRLNICLAVSVFIVLVNMTGQTVARYASIMGTWTILLALLCVKIEEDKVKNKE